MHLSSLCVVSSHCLLLASLLSQAHTREIVFPPVAAVHPYGHSYASPLAKEDVLLQAGAFPGLTTWANLPYVRCLADTEDVEKYDIAILGAPFDTATTARPGARFGPMGIRAGSRRMSPGFATGPDTGENSFEEWAKIVDCGKWFFLSVDPRG